MKLFGDRGADFRRLTGTVVWISAVLGIGFVATAPPASATPPFISGSWSGQSDFCWEGGIYSLAWRGDHFSLVSGSGYEAKFQGDGNFVIYYRGHPIWDSGTGSGGYSPNAAVVFGPGSYFGVENPLARFTKKGYTPVGSTDRSTHYGLVMQGDGNLVIYHTNSIWLDCAEGVFWSPIWASNTVGRK